MRDGFRALEGVKVIAAAAAIDEVEVVVVVPDAQPAQSRGTPPLLVVEADLVAEPRLAGLTGESAGPRQSSEPVYSHQRPAGRPARGDRVG